MHPIKRIVLTGGPCGGKSTSLARLVDRFDSVGVKAITIPELATQFIVGGIRPWDFAGDPGDFLLFQRSLLQCQIAHELAAFEMAKRYAEKQPVAIFLDRGVCDAAAYCTGRQWASVLQEMGLNAVTARDLRYDAVFHLVSAANGAEEHYTLANNTARTESAAEARAADERTLGAWVGHPHLRVFDNRGSFSEKLQRVMEEAGAMFGLPSPSEIERKYLVRGIGVLPAHAQTFEIVQHYIPNPHVEERIRCRQQGQGMLFTRTLKSHGNGALVREEQESIISAAEYQRLLRGADPVPVRKRRTCFVHEGQYFELDQFSDFPLSILEIEIPHEAAKVVLPPFLTIDREVTSDPQYSNRALQRLQQA